MVKMTCCVSDKISHVLNQQFDKSGFELIYAGTDDFTDSVISTGSDFLLVQVQENPAFYRKEFMRLYLSGHAPYIIIFCIGKDCQLASSFDPDKPTEEFKRAKSRIYKALFLSILQTRSSMNDSMQFISCPDIARRSSRFIREEHLREILSGVSDEQFSQIKQEFNLSIGSPRGHYLIVSKAMPFNYFDDYTHNRRIYRMLDEMLHDELYKLLNKFAGGEVFETSNNSKCIIINDFSQPSARKYTEQYNMLMSGIRQLTDDGMTALFLGRHIDSQSDFNAVYRECINAKRMRIFYGEEALLPVSVLRQKRDAPDVEELERCLDLIRDFSIISPLAQLDQAVNRIFLQILKPSASINMYYYSCSAINVIYDSFCQRYGISPERRAMSRCFDKYTTVEEISAHYIRIFRNARLNAEKSSGHAGLLIGKMTAYIEKNYASDITLNDLAELIGFSQSYTSRYFHRQTGKSFSKYLTEYRIDKAKELIAQSSRPIINDIARAVGYNNPQFFSRTFRAVTGCSPSEYAASLKT